MDEIQKVFYSWNIRVTIHDCFAKIENFVIPCCFRLKLHDPVAKFIDCACTNFCIYLLTSNEVIRFKNLAEELLIGDLLKLEESCWRCGESVNVVKVEKDESSNFFLKHVGLQTSSSYFHNNFDHDCDAIRPLLACTNDKVYLVSMVEKYPKLCCIDSLNGDGIFSKSLPNISYVRQLKGGHDLLVLLDSTGTVYVSGCGTRGEMGCGKLILKTCLRKVPMFTTFKIRLVSVGGWHVLALDDGDNVFGWGWNGSGQLGFPKDERSVVLYPEHICIPTAASLKSVACGSRHSLILAEGEVYGCGWNEYGQIGNQHDGNFCKDVDSVRLILSEPRLVGIAAGGFSSLLFLKEKTNVLSLWKALNRYAFLEQQLYLNVMIQEKLIQLHLNSYFILLFIMGRDITKNIIGTVTYVSITIKLKE
ncbi:RCC1 domain-containing protein 1 [Trichinella britovi]|uniref:RCC1 domain-containing protein 1 n=1 Tax=Trichinella britovi TaxID=45882 RepID=A0A0V1DAF6_TRIBR|nr:RCC1 domain-containing protein 1 [Trichinella britovi]